MSMKTLALLCLPLLLALPARAQMSAGIAINNDGVNNFYLAIGQNYSYPQREVVVIHDRRIPDEELPVVFFIARQAGVTPEEVVDLRLAGYSWMDITLYYNLSPSIYYVALDGDPGPYYGRAYGYWSQPRDRWSNFRFEDDDIVNMVNLQFVSTHYGVRPDEVVRVRGQQPNFVNVTRVVSSPDYRSSRTTGRQQQPVTIQQQQPATVWQQQPVTVRQQQPVTSRQVQPAMARQVQPAAVRQVRPVTVKQQQPATVRPQQPATVRPQQPATARQLQPAAARQLQPAAARQQQPATVRPQQPTTARQLQPATAKKQPRATAKKQPSATVTQQPSAPAKKQQDGGGQDKGSGNGTGKDQNDNNH